jgi:hypothetical protein
MFRYILQQSVFFRTFNKCFWVRLHYIIFKCTYRRQVASSETLVNPHTLLYTEWHKKNGKFWKSKQKLKKSKKQIYWQKLNHHNLPLRESNPNYQCLKITFCRWRPPPRMHSFTATTHFKSSRSFVSPCVCCMLCRMRQSRILHLTDWNTWNTWISRITTLSG